LPHMLHYAARFAIAKGPLTMVREHSRRNFSGNAQRVARKRH
jgi:hypothetical protein